MIADSPDPDRIAETEPLSPETAGKHVDETFRESEARHRTLLEALVDGVFVAQNHRFVFANAALPEMLGQDPSDFKDIPFSCVIAPDDLDLWAKRFDAWVGDGLEPECNYIVRLLHRNGEQLEAELRARRIAFRGQPAVLGVLRDVTERRKAETALRQSEMRHRSLVEAVSAVTWNCPPSGLPDTPQPEWTKFTGQPTEDILGMGWAEALHPDDAPAAAERWQDAVARGEPYAAESRYRRFDGEWRWMSVRAVPIRDSDGRVLEWFGMSIDVTERVAAQEALRESEARLRTILDGVGACIYLKDNEGRYLFANAATRRLWGAELEEIVGFGDEKFFDAATLVKVRETDRCVLEHGETLRLEESTGILKTGESGTFLSVKLPLRDAEGRVYALCGISTDITESARTAASLSESEKRYRSLFENMNSGFGLFEVVTDSAGCPVDLICLAINGGFEAATGLKSEELIGKRLTERFPGIENDSADWIGIYGGVALTGVPRQFEAASKMFGLSFSVAAYQPAPGQCAITFQDITKRKAAEAEILRLNANLEQRVEARTMELEAARRNAEGDSERLRLALSAGAIGAWERDIKSRALVVDGGWRSLYGVADDETVSMDVFERLVHPDDLKIVTAAREQASMSSDGTYVVEYRIRRGNDGAERWMRSRAQVYFEGDRADRVRGVSVDITDERLLEHSLRERMLLSERIAKSEERLRAVIDGVGDAIITLDEKGLVQSINRSGVRIFGYEETEIVGQNIRLLLDEPYFGAHNDAISRHIETGKSEVVGFSRLAEGRRKGGSKFPIELAISEVHHDHLRLFVGFLRDLSAQRKAEAEVEALRTERLSAIGGMAVALAHEINQPFLATIAYVDCARAYLQNPTADGAERAREALDLASEAIIRAGQITKHLREFTSSGEPDKTFRRLHDVLRLAVTAMAPALAQSEIDINLLFDAPRDRVLVDAVQIKQVFINLIRNAKQAMTGGRLRRLTVSTAFEGQDMIRIEVADTGTGLSAAIKDQLFEPFATTKEGGMGIGLAISQSIVRAHYGELSAHSNEGGGTVFRVTLPLESEPTHG